jgi:hypothetical protein
MFGPNARETLGDKMELYFRDHSFVPLFIQVTNSDSELVNPNSTGKLSQDTACQGSQPRRPSKDIEATRVDGQSHIFNIGRRPSRCYDSWVSINATSLFTLDHDVTQTGTALVIDAFTCSVFNGATCFIPVWCRRRIWQPKSNDVPSVRSPTVCCSHQSYDVCRWLGQNSKQNKLSRELGDVQVRMRLKVSGDKHEIRQSYIPALYPHVVKPLIDRGAVGLERLRFLCLIFIVFCRLLSMKSSSRWTSTTFPVKIGILSSSLVWTRTKMM